MKDTSEVLAGLNIDGSQTKLLAIVANERGAENALRHKEISYLGYPFSISETFQMRNTNATIEESVERVKQIQTMCQQQDVMLVVYVSMGFGNPYGDTWNANIVKKWVDQLIDMDIRILSLSDTIGIANPKSIEYIFSNVIPNYKGVEFGAHLHTQASAWKEKVDAAYHAGCRRFDSAIRGYGGCPMAKDDLTGNMATENLLYYLDEIDADLNIDRKAFNQAMSMALDIFPH